MLNAKDTFLSRIKSLDLSLKIDAVKHKPFNDPEEHTSTMLRNGLAVVAFTILEDFIKMRSSEVLDQIGNTHVSFTALPKKLRTPFTYKALNALQFQTFIEKDENLKIAYIQEQAKKIASTANASFEITPHAFAHGQSNVTHEEIESILIHFCVKSPWTQMSKISSKFGWSSADSLRRLYKNASDRRHAGAHDALANTPLTELYEYIAISKAIAFSFDCLISHAFSLINSGDNDYLNDDKDVLFDALTFRILMFEAGKWKERVGSKSIRAKKVSRNYDSLRREAAHNARGEMQMLIVFDKDDSLKDWSCA